jgi:type IV pilus assembly protein PilE
MNMHRQNNGRDLNFGFTLIELMVVVAVVAILASIALPSYQDSVRKAARRAGQAFMLEIANRERQYFLETRDFTPGGQATMDQATIESTLKIKVPTEAEDRYTFKVDRDAGPPLCFTITATAIGNQVKDTYPTLTLTCTGAKNW